MCADGLGQRASLDRHAACPCCFKRRVGNGFGSIVAIDAPLNAGPMVVSTVNDTGSRNGEHADSGIAGIGTLSAHTAFFPARARLAESGLDWRRSPLGSQGARCADRRWRAVPREYMDSVGLATPSIHECALSTVVQWAR